VEETDPVVPLCLHDAMPQAGEHPELLAPEPSILVGLNRLVEPSRQAQSLQLACLGLVEKVLRRAEDPGVVDAARRGVEGHHAHSCLGGSRSAEFPFGVRLKLEGLQISRAQGSYAYPT